MSISNKIGYCLGAGTVIKWFCWVIWSKQFESDHFCKLLRFEKKTISTNEGYPFYSVFGCAAACRCSFVQNGSDRSFFHSIFRTIKVSIFPSHHITKWFFIPDCYMYWNSFLFRIIDEKLIKIRNKKLFQ